MTDYLLYSTEACHLCELAEQLLQHAGLAFTKQDIIEDEQAQQLYAIRIPVLKHVVSGAELGWPFDHQQLQSFIGCLSSQATTYVN